MEPTQVDFDTIKKIIGEKEIAITVLGLEIARLKEEIKKLEALKCTK
jgi:hypothetical protein